MNPTSPQRSVSGRLLVLWMFIFAALVSLGLWTYWELHTRPFRPLTDALAEQFPGSNPRVEGGKHGLHKPTARILRIIMRVQFDPQNDDQFALMADEVYRIVREKADLTDYDRCDIHLFEQKPEQEPRIRVREIMLSSAALPLPATH